MPRTKPGSRSLVPKKLTRDRKRIMRFIHRGQDLAEALGEPALVSEVKQLAASAAKPFLFVVVGEVKSGKSSLINALLEAPLCAVDTAPCTARVQEINFGEVERRTEVSEHEERLHLPHDILRHIAIVDTPGTNSIISQHQHITDNYLPQSDLILFVFFAKNPYTGSTWDFLRHIKRDWQRNTLFVLQQSDLLEPRERKRTLSLVKQQLATENITDPLVFEVSVMTGEGVETLREYLRSAVIEGRQFNKNISLSHNLLRFLRRLDDILEDHLRLLQHDDGLMREFNELVKGSDDEAREAYDALSELARNQAETTRHWLDAHFGDVRDSTVTPAPVADPGATRRRSPRQRLREIANNVTKSLAVRDALSGGWETPLRIAERFNQLQIEFNRCLFQGELRGLALCRQRLQRAQRLFDAITAEPDWLDKPLDDRLSRQRLATLLEAQRRVETITEPPRDAPVSPPAATGNRSRWSVGEHLAQVGASLSSLLFGYYVTDLFSALLFGLVGYLGAGYGLAVRHRGRVAKSARAALERSLAQLDERLHAALLARPDRLRRTMRDALRLCEGDRAKRRTQIDNLRLSIERLHQEVAGFESTARLEEKQGAD